MNDFLDFPVQVVLKDEPDIDPNDQNSILEHLDKVVSNSLFAFFSTGGCPESPDVFGLAFILFELT